ncbi:hypothetical protein [Lentzea flaviverrucosa]|uniref:Phospho-2-dehydro-3-deoxyheptonate aldolase n=1 Tax=Lentzea flaviverrucosa TaxID=200379 RepID=A0A1H9C359_9PSEU|nr:hypothetical protein [Lentzea flaviverrucosa]RDI24438.1 phospho-2-dehydro-3-deoxyheptonate aldolase [Lentzea flaviverrucosa]SEP95592.1 phospho-2-dehydro-3-deoxyheptonate aldolase [Lentzea flaviverrucosa]
MAYLVWVEGEVDVAGMIESYLADGNQKTPDRHDLSLTGVCLGWRRTAPLLEALARSRSAASR